MEPDPAIDDIREVRRQISAEFGHDPRRLMAHYIEFQERLKREGRYRFVGSPQSEPAVAALNDKPSQS